MRELTFGVPGEIAVVRPRGGPWAALAVLCASVLIVNVDTTILNVALPTLVERLHASSSQLQWIVDTYAMIFGGLLLVGGSLADRFGRRRILVAGLGAFGGGSVGAAFSGSVGNLIGWRGVMGAGAALMMPATLSIINDVFPDPRERARAVGTWAGTSGLGIAIGPVGGGLLLAHFWWGAVFLVNVPIVAAALVGVVLLVPESRNPRADRPDPVGAVSSILGLGLVLWAVIEAPGRGWTSGPILGAGAGGVAVLALFAAWELRCDHPMLNLGFFRSRRFSAASAGLSLGMFGLMGSLFVQTQFLQFGLGYSPIQAGLRLLPVAAVVAVVAPTSPLLVRALGSRLIAGAGLLGIAGGLWQVSAASTVATSYPQTVPGLLLIGLGAGLLMPTATDSVLGSLPREQTGVGSATNGVAIQVGGALGVGVVGSLLSTRYRDHLTPALAGAHVPATATHTIVGSLGGAMAVAERVGGAAGALLTSSARAAFMSGAAFSLAVAAAVVGAAAAFVFAALPARPPVESAANKSGSAQFGTREWRTRGGRHQLHSNRHPRRRNQRG